ncbi:MAG: VCBS repeat-containing protein [Bacteroidia bacterium]|nr:VCBS repeat-containing protein [Bacteroidia bacterium]
MLPAIAAGCILLLAVGCGGGGERPLFRQLAPSATGVDFANTITENARYNIISFEYVYNGGGVAVADLNQDGWSDLFFTGNQADNRLYLNQGGMKFRDVSEAAGILAPGRWCSGVVAGDVNGDGLTDLYVCANMELEPEHRANLLYLNLGPDAEGVPRFRDIAPLCGVADTGYSTQAAFLDYDRDGDLDLYVVTNQVQHPFPNKYRPKLTDGSALSTDRLYRNDGPGPDSLPRFTNVSREAGILTEGYGLGISIVDLNRDQWPDIYVTNDYLSNDLLWINQRDGTFRDEAAAYFKHTCHSAMGQDAADINNDGWLDFIALDMLPADNLRKKLMIPGNQYSKYINNERYGYQYQYIRNVLQLNPGIRPGFEPGQGGAPFSEIGCMSGVFETDWSWSALFADFDHDGFRDLFITNGFPKDITDMDFSVYRAGTNRLSTSKEELLSKIPEVKIPNYLFRNRDGLTFEDKSEAWGIAVPSFTNGAAYADLDRDGDLDLVTSNIDAPAGIFENQLYAPGRKPADAHYIRFALAGAAGNPGGWGSKLWIYAGGRQWYHEHSPVRGYLSTVEPYVHIGLGAAAQVDSVRIRWPDGHEEVQYALPADQVASLSWADAQPVPAPAPQPRQTRWTEITGSQGLDFLHEEDDFIDFNVQRSLPHKLSQYGPALACGDVNGDGLEDVFIGGPYRFPSVWLMQQRDGSFRKGAPLPGAAPGKREEDTGALLFDADGDGDLDLYLASGGNEHPAGDTAYRDRLYVNLGAGRWTLQRQALPDLRNSSFAVKAADMDRDGDLDVLVTSRLIPQQYPQPASCVLLRNDTRQPDAPVFTDVTASWVPALQSIGLTADALWTDANLDGRMDLLLAGEWMSPVLLLNTGERLEPAGPATGLDAYPGWWNSISGGDIDNDGDTDYLLGNLGLNTLYQASPEMPIQAWSADFDANGSEDVIVSAWLKGADGRQAPYPVPARDDLISQLVHMRRRFEGYGAYGRAQMDQVLTAEERAKARVLRATWMRSSLLRNLGAGPDGVPRFEVIPLPAEAQIAPLYGTSLLDLDGDSWLDVMAVGNAFDPEIFQGRIDALNGWTALGDGRGGFRTEPVYASGFCVPGDGKSLVLLPSAGRWLALAGQNRGPMRSFAVPLQPARLIPLQPGDAWAEFTLPHGARRRQECYYGSSFLSQSARCLQVPEGASQVRIADFQGNIRTWEP